MVGPVAIDPEYSEDPASGLQGEAQHGSDSFPLYVLGIVKTILSACAAYKTWLGLVRPQVNSFFRESPLPQRRELPQAQTEDLSKAKISNPHAIFDRTFVGERV